MKILRVIASMDPKIGGPCQGIRNSIPAMQNLGVLNDVVCLDSPDASYLGKDAFTIYALGPSKGPWGYSKSLIPWLKQHATNYNAIIIHGLWQYNSYAVYQALKGMKESPNYFVMPHGMLDPYFQKAPERRVKAMRNWLFWKFIEHKVVNNATGVLFTCEEELILARQAFTPYHPKLELNVGYGIQDPPTFSAEMTLAFHKKSNTLNKRPFVLFLSRIHQKKGIDLLINAYKQYLIQNSCDFDLVIAGPGLETEYGTSLLESVESNNTLKSRVHFTGMLSGDAKWGAFYNAEAFILPSHQENFGIAIVEALACGTPVLISDKVNIWREIEHRNAGIIANDDIEGTFNLLQKFGVLTQVEKTKMSQDAHEVFREQYSILPAAKKLTQTLKDTINA